MSIIKDLSLADWGRKEIVLAELEFFMSYRSEHSISKPLTGARISGALHMTIQTAVLIETLKHCGADIIRWCSCNVLSTQDHAAAAIVKAETATVFAWKGETLREFWESMVHAVTFEDGEGPSLIVDDGCDMTIFLLEGYNCERTFEKTSELPKWETYEIDNEREMMKMIRELLEKDKKVFTKLTKNLKGVSEETTSGATRLYQLQKKGMLKFPAINVNNSVTKTKFDNIYGCRQSVADDLMRATDIMIAGKKVLICGYGDVGKGCAASMKGFGARVYITEIDPICALQACMEGYEVVTLEKVVQDMDIIITTTGNKNIILASHMSQMKSNAILGNMGVSKIKIKDQVEKWIFEDGHGIIILAEGRLLNLACATGHPSFVMSNSFTNQVMAINELWTQRNSGQYKNFVYKLSKKLDEKVAKLHLKALGAELTILTSEQAEYINVKPEGPFKKEDYRY